MRAESWSLGRKPSLFVLALLGACTALHPGPALVGPTENRVSEGRSPHIALLAEAPRPDRIVAPAFQVDAEGYALVVAVDRDQRIHVLFPDSPRSDGFVTPRISHMAAPFFEGSGRGAFRSALFDAGYSSYGRAPFSYWPDPYRPAVSRYQAAVFIVAIVSGEPLQLERLRDATGGWAEAALRNVVLDPVPSYVGERLGQLVSGPGQRFSTDYRVIVGAGSSPLYASSYYRGCGFGAFAPWYDGGYFWTPRLGLDSFQPRGASLVTDVDGGDARFAVYPLRGACGGTYLWDAPGTNVRRPPELFPRDTSLLFTTRRIAMRVPGGGGISTPQAFPAPDDRGNGIPDLWRGGVTASRGGEENASAPAAPRAEPRTGTAKAAPATAPPPRGRRQ